jgi:hypothetical protein
MDGMDDLDVAADVATGWRSGRRSNPAGKGVLVV